MKKYSFLFLNILNKKKLCRFSIIIFCIMTIFYIVVSGLNNEFKNKYNKIKLDNIDHNYIVIGSANGYAAIKKDIEVLKNIEDFYPLLYVSDDIYDYIYEDNSLIPLTDGKHINSRNEIIVQKNNKYKLNDVIKLNIKDVTYELKIVGFYDSNERRFSSYHSIDYPIFMSYDLMNEISNLEDVNEVVVKINDYENIDEFLTSVNLLENYDIIVYDSNSQLIERYYNFCSIFQNLSNLLTIFCFLVIVITGCIIIYDNKYDIAIMKSVGYSNIRISLLMTFYSLLLLLLSLLPTILILFIIYIVFSELIITISIIFRCLLYFIMLLLFVAFILFFIIYKINIVKLIKN